MADNLRDVVSMTKNNLIENRVANQRRRLIRSWHLARFTLGLNFFLKGKSNGTNGRKSRGFSAASCVAVKQSS